MNEIAPDYEELVLALERLQSGVGAADLHGSLSGFLCAGGRSIETFLTAMAIDQVLLDQECDSDVRGVIGRLYRSCDAGLDDPDFAFNPLLPDDDQPLDKRAQALVQWCQGFVGGLGFGGFSDMAKLSPEGREVLADLAEIARSHLAFDDDEDADELALGELREFVRVGALLLREDLRRPSLH